MKNITKIKQLAIDHDYYCNQGNYYSNEAQSTWSVFDDFIGEYGNADIDMNLCFRFDVKQYDEYDFEEEGKKGYYMEIFIMGQRKGLFKPNLIEQVTDEDVPKILAYLKPHFDKIKSIWKPF